MHWASFHLKYYQSNLHAECLCVRIRLSLAAEGQILTCSSQDHNICCCSQGKIPGEPKEPLGIIQSVCSGVCSRIYSWMVAGGYFALWLSLLWPCCDCWRLAEGWSQIWSLECGKGLKFLCVAGVFHVDTGPACSKSARRQLLSGDRRTRMLLFGGYFSLFLLSMHYPVTGASQALRSSPWWMVLGVPQRPRWLATADKPFKWL